MMQKTTEQLQQLIESVYLSAATGTATVVTQSKGSFSNCSSVFSGQSDKEAVEAFITSILTYKEIEWKGISLLFYGSDSTWWQGVEPKTWNDVLNLIRDHFSPTYQLYMEISEKRQDETTAFDTFVCQKRDLLVELPEDRHYEATEIDLIYGLLNIKYRKHIAPHDVETFRDLLAVQHDE